MKARVYHPLIFFLVLVTGNMFFAGSVSSQTTMTTRATGNWNANNTWISATLTGTISTVTTSNAVTGTGTNFTGQLRVGAALYQTNGNTLIGTILTINSNTSITLTANASNTNTNINFLTRKIPGSTDAVVLTSNGWDVTIPASYAAACASLEIGVTGTNSAEFLSFSVSSSLIVSGNVTVFGPSANNAREIRLNTGIMTVGGNLSLGTGQTGNQANRVSRIIITTGTITVAGNLTFNSPSGGAAAQNQIVMSGGAGTFNLAGAFTINNNSGTITPGAASTFNFNGSSAGQTIPIGVSSVVYNNLVINNTNSSGANLSAAITATNVTGNLSVGSINSGSLLSTNNNAVTLAKSLTVGTNSTMNAGTSIITMGTASSVTINGKFQTASLNGFSGAANTAINSKNNPTITLGASSTVEYNALADQVVTNRVYNNLILSGSGAKTIGTTAGGSLTVGNLSIAPTGSATAKVTNTNVSVVTLTLGGVNKVSGTWGSTSSGATNQSNTYFASTTGYLNITTDTRPSPVFSNITSSQIICFGILTMTLSGNISATGPLYPEDGEIVSVTINGDTQDATIAGGVGGFTIDFPTSAIPASGTPYTITYIYEGSVNLKGAVPNTSTTLTVNASTLVTGQSTATQTTCQNVPFSPITVTATGTGTLNYQWYSNIIALNNSGSLLSGATNSSYTPSASATGTLYYYAVVSSACSSDTTVVSDDFIVNASTVISSQSTGGQTQCSGVAFTPISVVATGDGTLTYQWYSNTSSLNTGGSIITGATSNSYTPSSAIAGTLYYYCVVTGTCGTATSTISGAFLVNPSSVGGTISGAVTEVCLGSSTGTLTLSGSAGTILEWDRQLNSGGWSSNGNGGSTTYSEVPYAGGTWQYRAIVQNGSCPLAYSSVVSVIVDPTTAVGYLGGGATPICQGTSTGVMTLGPSTGNITRWEKRINSGSWTNISNTSTTYSEIPSSAGTWDYRVLVQSGTCSSLYSNILTVVVNPTLTITLGPNPVICLHTTVAQLSYTATTGSPAAYGITFDAAAVAAGMVSFSGYALPSSPIAINVPYSIATGVYNGTLTVSTYSPICSSIGYPMTITVQDNTIATTITGASSPCQGSSQTYSAVNISGAAYTWTFPSGWVQTGGGTTNSVIVTVGASAGNVQVTPTFTCGNGTTQSLAVSPSSGPIASISYSGSPFCKSLSSSQSVTFSGTSGGTYSASPSGLTINSSTGAITPSTSTAGTYTVTYTVTASGGCGVASTTTPVTITTSPVATFSYAGSPYCSSGTNLSPTFSGGGVAGTFTSTTGLVFISTSTGQINLSSSTPGTYTVTNTIAAVGGCAIVTATSSITILPQTAITTYSANAQTQCLGGTFTPISVVATGAGTLTYQWYSNATSSNTGGSSITGATGSSYIPSTAITGTLYYYCVVTGTCSAATSAISGAFTVNAKTAISSQSTATQTQCISGTFTPIAVTATGIGLTYQWYSNTSASTSGGTSLALANGAQTNIYTPQTTVAGTLYYYCVVTGTCSSATSTVSGAFIVNAATAISSQSTATQTQCIAGTFTPITVTATGTGLTYQWYSNITAATTGGTSLVSGNGAQTNSYTPQATVAGTLYYYCIVTGTCGTATSSVSGAFIVNPVTTISSQSTAAQTRCITLPFTPISITASGTGLSYQWFSNSTASTTGGTSLGTANGAQTNSYTPQTTVVGTLYFYCIVSGTCGTVTSSVSGAFTVNPATLISAQSTSTQTQCINGTFIPVTVTATGTGTLTYQWFSNTTSSNTGGSSLGSANGAQTNSYTPQATAAGTLYYYCVVTGSCTTATSSVSGALVVNPATTISSQSTATQSTCLNVAFTPITVTATGTGTLTYQWYSNTVASNTGGISLGSGNGAQTNNYTPQSTAAGTLYYYCIVHGNCGVDISSSVSGAFIVINDLTWLGSTSSDWNTVANWSCPYLPNSSTNVLIGSATNQPLLSSGETGTCKNIVINSGSSLTVNSGGTLQIAETITNSGTFTASAGTIELIGTTAQIIGSVNFAANTIQNLIVSNPAGVTLSAPLNVAGVVKAATGNLTSGGNLTLLSTGSQTALIDGSGAADVLGSVTMQRNIPSAFGYKYVSTPFTSNSVSDFSPIVDLSTTFPSFYKYDENNSRDSSGVASYQSGWVKYLSGTLSPMTGYAANLGAGSGATTLSLTGTVNNGSMLLSLYNHNRKFTQGFNLVGNPYPSPIDWDIVAAASSNINGSVYFFNSSGTDQYTGTYTSYVNGVGVGSNIIAAMQGFFVNVSSSSGTLAFSNAVRTNSLNPSFKEAKIDDRVILQFAAKFDVGSIADDVAIIYFDNTTTLNFDWNKDALKLMNTDLLVPNLYTISGESKQASIKAMPIPTDSITRIPLGVTTLSNGWITLRASDISLLPSSLYIYLIDAEKGITQDLKKLPDYRFNLKAGTYNNRFSLVFSLTQINTLPTVAEKMFSVTRSGSLLKVTMNLPLNTNGSLYVTNVSGQIILRREVSDQETVEITPGSSSGLYIITVVAGNKKASEKILIRKDYE